MTHTEACIALNMVPKMGPVRLRKLLEVFETPQRILCARASELRVADGIGQDVSETVAGWEKHVDLAAELKRIADFGAHVVTQESPEYPRLLREIHNPPIVLYVWGKIDKRDHEAIGNDVHQTLQNANSLIKQLDQQVAPEARKTLAEAQHALGALEQAVGSTGPLQGDA